MYSDGDTDQGATISSDIMTSNRLTLLHFYQFQKSLAKWAAIFGDNC